jgi:hypothetical protein
MSNVEGYRGDKFSYRTLCDVAVELVRNGVSAHVLDEAIKRLRDAAERILNPEMNTYLRSYEALRARMCGDALPHMLR